MEYNSVRNHKKIGRPRSGSQPVHVQHANFFLDTLTTPVGGKIERAND